VQALSEIDDERQLIRLMMDAIALWFDADVRAYRQDFSGAFVLDAWLPGSDTSAGPLRIPGTQIWERHEIFAIESVEDLEVLKWDARLADAREVNDLDGGKRFDMQMRTRGPDARA